MINIYIDESGVKEINSSKQPVYLLSAVLIDTSKHSKVEEQLNNLISSSKSKVNTVLKKSLIENPYTKDRTEKILKYLNEVVSDKFEIHSAEIIRGENAYSILSRKDRVEIINKGISIIKDNNLNVITVACKKEEYKNSKTQKDIDIKDIQENMHQDMVKTLVKELENYLKDNHENAFIFADEQNYTIEKFLIPYLESGQVECINPVIIEAKSHKKILIQLADISAYSSNLKIRSEVLNSIGKRSKESLELLEDLSSVNNIVYIGELEVKKELN